jgi:hypothetical protein
LEDQPDKILRWTAMGNGFNHKKMIQTKTICFSAAC